MRTLALISLLGFCFAGCSTVKTSPAAIWLPTPPAAEKHLASLPVPPPPPGDPMLSDSRNFALDPCLRLVFVGPPASEPPVYLFKP